MKTILIARLGMGLAVVFPALAQTPDDLIVQYKDTAAQVYFSQGSLVAAQPSRTRPTPRMRLRKQLRYSETGIASSNVRPKSFIAITTVGNGARSRCSPWEVWHRRTCRT